MIPNNLILDNVANGGQLMLGRYVAYGEDCLFRGGHVIGEGEGGIDFQTWRARIIDPNTVEVVPLTSGVGTTLDITGVEACSVAFDRGMNFAFAFVQGGDCFLTWFDTVVDDYVTTAFPNARNIMVVHDDVRDASANTSDVLVTYQRGNNPSAVYWRQQRDRYANEYTANDRIYGELKAFGMGSQWKILWRWEP